MKENIIGNTEMIKWGKELQPGNRICFINWEAVEELPPQFESVITTLKIDIKNNFTEISKKYMPTTDLSYKIAEACGISGDTSKVEPFYEEVDINPMLCKPIYDEPTYRKLKTGVTVTKQSKRMMEDGTYMLSSPCSNTYNVWDRCTEDWKKEEMYTEGYTKPAKFGNYKYDTSYKRQYQFATEMKFAHQKAESKAYCKTIRELAGLPTAFERSDLESGVLMFSKVRRSAKALQLEQAAYLSSISQGNQQKTNLLFDDPEPEPEQEPDDIIEEAEKVEDEPTLIEVLKCYKDTVGVSSIVDNMIKWLDKVGDACMSEENMPFYKKAIENLKTLESEIGDDNRIKHNLY
jgi:hypothetical protein